MNTGLQLVLAIINFCILGFILARSLRKSLVEYFQVRHEQIAENICGSRQKLVQETERCELAKRRYVNLEQEVAGIRQMMLNVGEKERRDLLKKAHAQIKRMEQEGRRQMEQEKERLFKRLRNNALNTAFQNAETELAKDIHSDRQRTVVAKSIAKLSTLRTLSMREEREAL
ncbi:MAG: hypothetical protein HY540_04185 [Deltaproteobacteria bacterium]|nr:hypothetical protein [Deltaproteobacteria bacterium]